MYERIVDVPRLMASYRTDTAPPALGLADLLALVQSLAPAASVRPSKPASCQ